MSAPLEELEALAVETRTKKGRMDADGRKKAAALIARIWLDPNADPRPTLDYIGDLKAEALADGIRMSWKRMGDDRRTLFEQWLPAPVAEKDIRRLAFLISSVLETDPPAAVRWLTLLTPAERKTTTKETRQHLATSLFTDADFDFHGLVLDTGQPRETYRLLGILWSVAIDPSFSVPVMARARLARAILAFQPSGHADQLDHIAREFDLRIRDDAAQWPAALRAEFDFKANARPAPNADHGAASPGAVQSDNEVATLPRDTANASVVSQAPLRPPSSEQSRPQFDAALTIPLRLADRIATLPLELDFLRAVQASLEALAAEKERLARDVAVAHQDAASLRDALAVATSARDSLQADAVQQRQRADRLSDQLARANDDSEMERRRLGQQINANAAGRIEEYRNRLGLTLSRLVKDLPSKQETVSPELGKVILLQFHQFLEALRQEGIGIQQGANSR